MPAPLSTHLPEVAGEFVEVNGEAIIETGLRDIQAATASPAVTDFTANEEAKVSCRKDPTNSSRLIIRVEKSGSNEGILGDSAITVGWIAFGK